MTIHLAFYKGPATNLVDRFTDWAIRKFTHSPYSHVEIVINGMGYSSSARDHGVRCKAIDFTTGKWDTFALESPPDLEKAVLVFFSNTQGLPYDWAGVARYVLPFLYNSPNHWYCSEWCSAALGMENTNVTPEELYQELRPRQNFQPCPAKDLQTTQS